MSAVKERVLDARTKRGLSQAKLADLMVGAGWSNYCQAIVSRIELGTRMVRLDESTALAKILRVTVHWLAGDEENSDDIYDLGYSDGLTAARKALERLR